MHQKCLALLLLSSARTIFYAEGERFYATLLESRCVTEMRPGDKDREKR